MKLNYEDAAWLWLESKPWAVTPELLFASKQVLKEEALRRKLALEDLEAPYHKPWLNINQLGTVDHG